MRFIAEFSRVIFPLGISRDAENFPSRKYSYDARALGRGTFYEGKSIRARIF
ncbi:MAG: hypothetical protein WDM96_06560 [Lacunisphaera sp.]